MNGQMASTPENMQRMMQQNRAYAQYQTQQQQSPNVNHYNRGSPNAANLNGMPSPAMLTQLRTSGGLQSPGISQAQQNGTPSHTSPHLQQQLMASTNGTQSADQPRPLSSGHVPAVAMLQHQLSQQNPQLSPEQVREIALQRLKVATYQQSRQNAINAATGIHGQAHLAATMQQQQGQLQGYAQQQQQTPTGGVGQQHSPYQQNIPAQQLTNAPQSRVNVTANQQNAALTQTQYQTQLRNQMYAQRQLAGATMTTNNAAMANNNTTAGRATIATGNVMRPPSRSNVAPSGAGQGMMMDPNAQQRLPTTPSGMPGTPSGQIQMPAQGQGPSPSPRLSAPPPTQAQARG